jgi:hypothetical protein
LLPRISNRPTPDFKNRVKPTFAHLARTYRWIHKPHHVHANAVLSTHASVAEHQRSAAMAIAHANDVIGTLRLASTMTQSKMRTCCASRGSRLW